MRLLPSSLQNISVSTSFKAFFARSSREDLIFSGTILLAFMFLAVFLWGGYVFYAARRTFEPESVLFVKVPSLTSADFDEAAKLLDARDQKFKDILAE